MRNLVPSAGADQGPYLLASTQRDHEVAQPWRVPRPDQEPGHGHRARGWTMGAAAVAAIALLWFGAILVFTPVRFVIHNPHAKTGFEMFLALGQLFGALVLILAPTHLTRARTRWVALGLCILGLGTLWFAYVYPFIESGAHLNVTMYGSLLLRTVGTGAMAVGLVPATPPPIGFRTAAGLGLATALLATLVMLDAHTFPGLIANADWETMVAGARTTFPGLTPWHWTLAVVPAILGAAAAWGAVRHVSGRMPGGWLLVAMVFLAAAQFHSIFWPSLYSSILTTTSVFRLGMTLVIVVGGVLELRAVTEERGRLLATELERVRRLEELSMLKRDFTSMVAHELATPVATIGMLARMIDLAPEVSAARRDATHQIQKEVATLQFLVHDIQASMDVERDDFVVRSTAVALRPLIEEAAAYATTMAGGHPLTVDDAPDLLVLADPFRIGQVLRNLLNNAARHTPPGTPIAIGLHRQGGHIGISVSDRGPGIARSDQSRIFGKFERGSRPEQGEPAGRGLGLYLSRRILERHGSGLTVTSAPGEGASFSFVLRVAS